MTLQERYRELAAVLNRAREGGYFDDVSGPGQGLAVRRRAAGLIGRGWYRAIGWRREIARRNVLVFTVGGER